MKKKVIFVIHSLCFYIKSSKELYFLKLNLVINKYIKKMYNIKKINWLYAVLVVAVLFPACKSDPINNELEIAIYYQPHDSILAIPVNCEYEDPSTLPKFDKSILGKRADAFLSSAYDLTELMPPVGDQGYISGSCVSWAVGYAFKSYQRHIKYKDNYTDNTLMSPSFMQHYIGGSAGNCRDGSAISLAFQLLQDSGCCSLADKPYPMPSPCNEITTTPTQSQREKASRNKIKRNVSGQNNWGYIDFNDIQYFISNGMPVVFRADIYGDGGAGNFYYPRLDANKQKWIWENHSGASVGGHAMIIVGYDDDEQLFKVQNSWGPNWCNSGFIYVKYNVLSNVSPNDMGSFARTSFMVAVDDDSYYGDDTYNLVVGSDVNGSVTTNPTNTTNLPSGSQVTLTATANNGYQFKNWTNMSGNIVSTQNPYTLSVTKNDTIMASFEQIAPTTYSLTVKIEGNGSVTTDPANTTNLPSGSQVTLTATANSGYKFIYWADFVGNIVSTANPYTIMITSDTVIVAYFEPITQNYNLVVGSDVNGSVTTNPTNTTNLPSGTQVTMTAIPNSGYKFKNWTDMSGNIVSTQNPFTYMVTKNDTIMAGFEPTGGGGGFSGGNGTVTNPYLITSKADMEELAYFVNNGDNWSSGKYFKLMNDITDPVTSVIGTSIPYNGTIGPRAFRGNFDGNGHKINLLINNSSDSDKGSLGLFGCVFSSAVIKNLGVIGDIYTDNSNDSCVGGLVGYISGFNSVTITNCYTSVYITAMQSAYVGGLIGAAGSCSINNCYSIDTVSGSQYVGGLIGRAAGVTISNCYTTSIAGAMSGPNNLGGLVGNHSSGAITNCYYEGYNNGVGTQRTLQEMQASSFVTTLNASQSPAPWKASGGLNKTGCPVLSWQQ